MPHIRICAFDPRSATLYRKCTFLCCVAFCCVVNTLFVCLQNTKHLCHMGVFGHLTPLTGEMGHSATQMGRRRGLDTCALRVSQRHYFTFRVVCMQKYAQKLHTTKCSQTTYTVFCWHFYGQKKFLFSSTHSCLTHSCSVHVFTL